LNFGENLIKKCAKKTTVENGNFTNFLLDFFKLKIFCTVFRQMMLTSNKFSKEKKIKKTTENPVKAFW
jgi:hypothetical protein